MQETRMAYLDISHQILFQTAKFCPVGSCTLCLENGVILPDSVDGLCKGFAELEFKLEGKRYLLLHLPWSSFWLKEAANTNIAMRHFDPLMSSADSPNGGNGFTRGNTRSFYSMGFHDEAKRGITYWYWPAPPSHSPNLLERRPHCCHG